ncbi:sensor histidine kinase [Dongia deserti]|uniref:sensor histidine kinase n=1 Tax=Dongia deserti TaxID=2268030 RepID=UPI000E65905C|nr:histidine kinase dimerization/phosphoacceptor domain -containing protein [Dongia deserti]
MFGQLLQPLRHRLILLFAIVLVVPSTFGIIAAIDRYRDQVRQAHESTVRFATLASNYETNLLWQSNRIIQNLAHQPPVVAAVAGAPGVGAECAQLLETAIRPYPAYAITVLRNAKGDAVCQSDPAAHAPNVMTADWFRSVMETRREAVSGYFYAARMQEGVIIYAAPVMNDRNEVTGVLSLAIRLEWLSAIGQEPGLPPDAMVYLLDRAGQVLVGPKAQGVDTQAGLPDAEIIQEVVGGYVRTFDSVGQDGIRRNYAVNVIGDKELFVLLGQPTARLIEPLWTTLLLQIGVLAFVSVAAMAAALIGTRFLVTKWINRLTEAAGSMSVGDLSVKREFEGAPAEFRELADTLREMAIRLDEREADLRQSLAQKQMMLREIHHRVKNNLQTVTSLLNLYARIPRGEAVKQAFTDVQMRINALALVHRHLYESQDMQEVDLHPFMTNLCSLLQDGSGVPPRRVRLNVDIPHLQVTGDRAVPLALLTTEILTNSFKHAFPNQRSGNIIVRISREENGMAKLIIADDGIGQSERKVDGEMPGSMGQTLIEAFTRQLGGEITTSGPPGTTSTLSFRLGPARPDTANDRQQAASADTAARSPEPV